jgi:hypothetical protein
VTVSGEALVERDVHQPRARLLNGLERVAHAQGVPVAGAADLAHRLRLDGAVATWRDQPPAVVALVLLALAGLRWEAGRVKARLLE